MSAAKAAARPPEAGTAYEDDVYTWTQEQGARLRSGDLAGLDLDNLAEEIESLGRTEFNSLVSAWRVILLHMLKWDHQPERRSRSCAISIHAHRNNAADVLKDNPGLESRSAVGMERAYRGARLEAANETGLLLKTFRAVCPYTRNEMLARPFPADSDDTTD